MTEISLETETVERLQREARKRGISPQELIEALLQKELRFPEIDPLFGQMDMGALVAALESHNMEVRERARDQLVALGPSILAYLERVQETATPQQTTEISECLARMETSVAILPLLATYAKADAHLQPAIGRELRALLRRYLILTESVWQAIAACTPLTAPLVSRQIKETQNLPLEPRDTLNSQALKRGLTAADIASLIALLHWQKTGTTAQQIAYALTTVALSSPTLELRRALPLLRPTWNHLFVPSEFTQAVKAIEEATEQWKDLPLPSESGDEADARNLPLPAEEPR